MTTMTTKRDLRNWVDQAMGADADDAIVTAVTDWIQSQDHPRWGADSFLAGRRN